MSSIGAGQHDSWGPVQVEVKGFLYRLSNPEGVTVGLVESVVFFIPISAYDLFTASSQA